MSAALVALLRQLPAALWPMLEAALRALLTGDELPERGALAVMSQAEFDRALEAAPVQSDAEKTWRESYRGYADAIGAYVAAFERVRAEQRAAWQQMAVVLGSIADAVRTGRASVQIADDLSSLAQFCALLAERKL